jgi:hypothetical protein
MERLQRITTGAGALPLRKTQTHHLSQACQMYYYTQPIFSVIASDPRDHIIQVMALPVTE